MHFNIIDVCMNTGQTTSCSLPRRGGTRTGRARRVSLVADAPSLACLGVSKSQTVFEIPPSSRRGFRKPLLRILDLVAEHVIYPGHC